MSRMLIVICLLASSAIFAKQFKINFEYQGLNLSDAAAKYELTSTATICNKVAVGIGGIAVYPKSNQFDAKIIKRGNNFGQVAFSYDEGGTCKYKLNSILLTFYKGTRIQHQTRFDVISEKEFGGSYLEVSEVLKHSDRESEIVCKKPNNTYLTCFRNVSDSNSVAQGMPGVLHIFQEYLTGNDTIDNVVIVRD